LFSFMISTSIIQSLLTTGLHITCLHGITPFTCSSISKNKLQT
jgi:hypothetical protein